MCKISLASKIPSADNIYKSAKGHKTNSMAGAISGIQSTIDTMSANSRNMCALPADSTLNHSTKLTDNAKKAISQQINELTKTGNPSYEIKTALFWQYAIPLMKAQLNDNAIDDQTLIKHFTNTAALDGKIQRFSDQIDSFKQQKLGSAKATHLQEAYRAIEESIETLLLPNSPLDKSKPEPTTSSGLKQPAARSNEVDGQIPVDEPATSYMPTGSGNSYHNCHFGNKITYVSSDQKPATATATTTVNVNGRNITSSEKEAQQAPSAFAKTQNITSNKLQQQQNIKENLPENNMLVTKDESIQVSSSQQNISTQNDDYDEVDGFRTSVEEKVIEEFIGTMPTLNIDGDKKGADDEWIKKEQPSVPLSRSQSEPALNIGSTKNGENDMQTQKDQSAISLSHSQSEPDLSVGNYQKVKDSDGKVRWEIKEKPHASNHIVLTNGTRQTANNAGTQKYFNNDSRRIEIDGANKSDKATETEEVKLSTHENLGRTLNVNVNMDINEDQTEAEISDVSISISPTNDVKGVDSSNINSRTGQPFKYSVSADKNVILTRGGQVSELAKKRSYSESDLRFKIEKSS